MYAAADGKSTLGIPQKVGAEFEAADKGGKLPKRTAWRAPDADEIAELERQYAEAMKANA